MHIPDGFLGGGLNTVMYIAAILVCSYAIKKVSQKTLEGRIPLLGVSVIFLLLIQSLNLPVDGVISTHIMGAVLLASILGPWETCLVMATVLIIQRLIFTYGGLSTLGANVFNLGVLGGVGGHYILMRFKKFFPHNSQGYSLALASTTWVTIMLVSSALCLEAVLSGIVKIDMLKIMGVQSLLGVFEAAITVGLVSALIKARPDLVKSNCCGEDKDSCYAHHHHIKTHIHEEGKEHDHGHIY